VDNQRLAERPGNVPQEQLPVLQRICHTHDHACKEQGINLPIQAVGDAVTTAWPALMQDLESEARARALDDYKDLADDTASLKAELRASQAVLDSERHRVERWDETIHDLKDKLAGLKWPPSTVSMTMSST
jgi:hypothetical protein